MHKIEAFIPVELLESTIATVKAFNVRRIDFFETSNLGVNAPQGTLYRGVSHASAYTPQIKLEIIVSEQQSTALIASLKKHDTEGLNDIFISQIKDA